MDLIKEYKKVDSHVVFKNIGIPCFLDANLMSILCVNLDSSLVWIFYMLIQFGFLKILNNGFYKNQYERVVRFSNVLKNTETYEKLKCEYDIFLEEITKYLKSKNLESSYEVILYLQKMLNSGGLSVTGKHQYHNFRFNYDKLIGLMGSRVTTGLTVCRHNACFVTDVMNKYGYSSYTVPVYGFLKMSSKLAKFEKSDHVISAIVDENGKYAYDPTNGYFVTSSDLGSDFLQALDFLGYSYHIDEKCQKTYNHFRGDEYKESSVLPFSEINFFEMEVLRMGIELLYSFEDKLNKDFYDEQHSRICEIAKLSSDLLLCTDSKIKSLILK